jgi:hypothetical protein
MSDVLGLGGAVQGAATLGAAGIQAGEEQAAINTQKQEFATGQANEAPWLRTGGAALGQLSRLYGFNGGGANGSATGNPAQEGLNANNKGTPGGGGGPGGSGSNVNRFSTFWQSPDYQFALTQGEKGITAQGAAVNGTDSGALRKAEEGYAGNLASGQYDTYKNGLLSLAGLGQTASGQASTVGQSNANATSALQQNMGDNLGSSFAAFGNMVGKGITQAGTAPAANSNVPDYSVYAPGGDAGAAVGF